MVLFSAWLFAWWIQTTVLLMICLPVVVMLRRPARQSLVIRAALVSVLACPIASCGLHLCGITWLRIDLALLASESFTIRKSAEAKPLSTVSHIANLKESDHLPSEVARQNSLRLELFPYVSNRIADSSSDFDSTEYVDRLVHAEGKQEAVAELSIDPSPRDVQHPFLLSLLPRAVVVAWFSGTLLLLFKLALDLRRSQTLAQQSLPVDSNCSQAFYETARLLGMRDQPRLCLNPFITSPCLVGHFKPVILLPPEIEPSQYRQVFIHELAHWQRNDWLWSVVGRLVVALMWCQPLCWWLHRKGMSVSEEICDDVVIQQGCNRESYLKQLLDIAELSMPTLNQSCVSMVGFRSKLGWRAVRILDTQRTLSIHSGRWFASMLLAGAVLVTAAVAMIGIGQVRASDGDQTAISNDKTLPEESEQNQDQSGLIDNTSAFNASQSIHSATPDSKAGSVKQDQQVEMGRKRRIVVLGSDKQKLSAIFVAPNPIRCDYRPLDFRSSFEVDGLATGEQRIISLMSSDLLYGKTISIDESSTSPIEVSLEKTALVKGIAIDSAGERVKGLTLNVRIVAEQATLPNDVTLYSVHTRSDGGFEFHLPSGRLYEICTHNSFGMRFHAFIRPESADSYDLGYLKDGDNIDEQATSQLRMTAPDMPIGRDKTENDVVKPAGAAKRVFEGSVTLGENGPPAANALVRMWVYQNQIGEEPQKVESTTDSQGRFRIESPFGDRFELVAFPPEEQPYLNMHVSDARWSEMEDVKNIRVALPQASLARGIVVEYPTGKPVANATVQFIPKTTDHGTPIFETEGRVGMKKTNAKGEFSLPIPPRSGNILVNGPEPRYLIMERTSRGLELGRPGGVRHYTHALMSVHKADVFHNPHLVELVPSVPVSLEVVDPQGSTIENAMVITRLDLSPAFQGRFRHTNQYQVQNGKVDLYGLSDGEVCEVQILDANRNLGIKTEITGGMPTKRIALEPCASLTARVVDYDGQPIEKGTIDLVQVVSHGSIQLEGAWTNSEEVLVDADYLSNIFPNKKDLLSDHSGRMLIQGIIPGVTYLYKLSEESEIQKFVAKSGEAIDLGTVKKSTEAEH